MVDFSKLEWERPLLPQAFGATARRPFIVRFVPDRFEPPVWVGGFAVVRDAETIRRVRRALRREQRELVKAFGTMPKRFRQDPFWWTPQNTKLVVIELLPPAFDLWRTPRAMPVAVVP
jgi:hypothetical protein